MSEHNGYVYQPYPKARYRNGEYMAVANEQEHAAAEAEGWTDWHSDQANMAAAAEPTEADAAQDGADEAPAADGATPEVKVRKKPGRKPRRSNQP